MADAMRQEMSALADALVLAAAAFGVLLGGFLFFVSTDPVMVFHGILLAGASAVGGWYILTRLADGNLTVGGEGYYNDTVIKAGVIATVFWGIVGFFVGVWIAWQLAFPALNFDLPWTNFGRLRPVHTSAVIFAFGGNALIATSFYVVQRTRRRCDGCHAR
jgi:cytochrome c oxidase cbb3-type subunit I